VRAGFKAAGSGLAAAALLAGCAVAPLRPPVSDPGRAFDRHVQQMRGVDEWVVRGRLAVRTAERGETASLYWKRERSDHTIQLYGPFGAGRVILTRSEQGATLRDGKDNLYEDDSAEALLNRVVGWRVPFESMEHWVLGVPSPDSPYEIELDAWGRLASLTQAGWRIEFQEYHYDDGEDLPRKMEINALPGSEHIIGASAAENETIRIKAYIRRWNWPRN